MLRHRALLFTAEEEYAMGHPIGCGRGCHAYCCLHKSIARMGLGASALFLSWKRVYKYSLHVHFCYGNAHGGILKNTGPAI